MVSHLVGESDHGWNRRYVRSISRPWLAMFQDPYLGFDFVGWKNKQTNKQTSVSGSKIWAVYSGVWFWFWFWFVEVINAMAGWMFEGLVCVIEFNSREKRKGIAENMKD